MGPSNPLNRPLAEGIRRVGFRKWYERELLSSHAHMLLAVLAVVGLLGSFEALRDAPRHEQLLDLFLAAISGVVGFWALRRYMYLLMHAEEIANQATCSRCNSYGQLALGEQTHRGEDARRFVPVCCKRCGFAWEMQDD